MKIPGLSWVVFVSLMPRLNQIIPLHQRNMTKSSRSKRCCTKFFCWLILWDRKGGLLREMQGKSRGTWCNSFWSESHAFGETEAQGQVREGSVGWGSLTPLDELSPAASSCRNTQKKKIHSKHINLQRLNSSWACVHLNFFLENSDFCKIHNSFSMPLRYVSHL